MAVHNLKIVPGSKAETYFMDVLKRFDVKPSSVMCRTGSIFGTDYNEYIISEGLYRQIRELLVEEA